MVAIVTQQQAEAVRRLVKLINAARCPECHALLAGENTVHQPGCRRRSPNAVMFEARRQHAFKWQALTCGWPWLDRVGIAALAAMVASGVYVLYRLLTL